MMLAASSAVAQPSKAEREDMAKAHEDIAACLRSDRALEECHKIMRDKHKANPEACRMLFDVKECPFEGKAKRMRGKNGMKGSNSAPESETK